MFDNQKYIRLLDCLKILSVSEFKQLKREIQSPLYGGSTRVNKLYAALSPKYPEFNLSPTDFRKISKKVFPNKNFSNNTLQKLFDDLFKITETYLLKLHLDKNDFLKEKITTSVTLERSGLYDLFQKSQQKMHEILEEKEVQDEEFWSEKVELYDRLYSNPEHNKYKVEDETLNNFQEATNRQFAHLKTRTALLQNTSDSPVEHVYLKEIMAAVEAGLFKEDNLLQLYCLLLEEKQDTEVFRKIEQKLNDAERLFFSQTKITKS